MKFFIGISLGFIVFLTTGVRTLPNTPLIDRVYEFNQKIFDNILPISENFETNLPISIEEAERMIFFSLKNQLICVSIDDPSIGINLLKDAKMTPISFSLIRGTDYLVFSSFEEGETKIMLMNWKKREIQKVVARIEEHFLGIVHIKGNLSLLCNFFFIHLLKK